jgi:hypothetical protein
MGKSAAGTQLSGHGSLKNEWEKVPHISVTELA